MKQADEAKNKVEIQMQEVSHAKSSAEEASNKVKAMMDDQRKVFEENQLRVQQILDVVKLASQGDLSGQLKVSGDDPIGQVAEGIRILLDNLSHQKQAVDTIITSLDSASTELNQSADNLSSTANEMRSAATTTQGESSEASAASREIAENVRQVAVNSKEMDESIKHITQSMNKHPRWFPKP